MRSSFVVTMAGAVALLGALALVASHRDVLYARAPDTSGAHVVFAAREEEPVVFIFGGDVMLDRSIRTSLEARGEEALFACLDKVFPEAEYVVANLEGPITEHPSRSSGSAIGSADNYVFTFPTSTAALLARHRVSALSLGNNHILNFGVDGMRSTIAALHEFGIAPFGEPYGNSVAHMRSGGQTFALIGFNEFDPAGWRAAASTTVAHVRAEAAFGVVPIVFAHWGEEYAQVTGGQRALAREFAQAGARLVVGAHPHIVQEREHIGPVPVYYSLGNLVFDQYWNEEVRTGLLLKVAFSQNGSLQAQEIPVRIGPGGRPCPVE